MASFTVWINASSGAMASLAPVVERSSKSTMVGIAVPSGYAPLPVWVEPGER
ncbi:hypothetical protein [Bradyrhizobium nanningense]|uniref:hypothetical protein n=1 Tax=Bradyrhizobium nanningense TaxID=1325118 RepID=UPI0013E8CE96|nr:hypothetical protein [Bradyrhizobium nanningense]